MMVSYAAPLSQMGLGEEDPHWFGDGCRVFGFGEFAGFWVALVDDDGVAFLTSDE